ncbi:MAG: response regulator [Bacteroidales bacterium]|nr:response regulator [Bacteroidales bacterium]
MEIIKDNAQSLIDSSFIKDSLASPNEDKSGQPDDNNRSRKKILIAEDTESNYMLVSYILKSQYDIEWAHDGVEAIEMYEKSKPDLILMDVRMPRLGGLSATSRIRETDKETPIIALTAFAFENDRAKTLEAGCTNFLAKPIKAAALKEMVAKYIGE